MKKTTTCIPCGDPVTDDQAFVRVKVLYGSRAKHPTHYKFHVLCWGRLLELASQQVKNKPEAPKPERSSLNDARSDSQRLTRSRRHFA